MCACQLLAHASFHAGVRRRLNLASDRPDGAALLMFDRRPSVNERTFGTLDRSDGHGWPLHWGEGWGPAPKMRYTRSTDRWCVNFKGGERSAHVEARGARRERFGKGGRSAQPRVLDNVGVGAFDCLVLFLFVFSMAYTFT